LAHDLKEPVRSIRSFSELMGQGDTPEDRKNRYLMYIQRAADRMGMLVETVFQYTQLDDPDGVPKEPCPMSAVLDMVREDLAQLITERSAVVTSDPLPEVHANSAQMIQVLQNLVSNAVRHCDGPVKIHVRGEDRADHWVFSVIDNGPGVDRKDAEKIFLPFKRLKRNEDCAGLGLATCRKIIGAHGGNIWCEPSARSGATFCFTLPKVTTVPAVNDRSVIDAAPDTIAASTPSLATVLLVDDREDDIDLTRYFLFDQANVSCNVRVALDGEQALTILREPKEQGSSADLMLLDINMPGMNGFELLERIRQDRDLQRLPVVMCTGSTYDKDQQRAEALGAVGYLVKPPSFDALKGILAGIATLRLDQLEGRSALHARQQAA